MGAFNTLKVKLRCVNCHKDFIGNLQFKIGDVRQYEYQVGDKVRISTEDKDIVGKEIVAYGILEDDKCPYCGYQNFEEYDIYVRYGEISGFDKMADLSLFLEKNEGRYFVKSRPSSY